MNEEAKTWTEIREEAKRFMNSPDPKIRERAKFIYELASDIRAGENTDAAFRIKRMLWQLKQKEKKKVANIKEITHKSSEAAASTFPDVCKTPTPAGPVPIPYPNTAKASDTSSGSKKVKISEKEVPIKNSSFTKSEGGEPPTTDSSEWKKAGSETQTIIGFVKKHPVLIGVTILTVTVIVWILASNILRTPAPVEPSEPMFSLDFWFL